MLRYQKITCPNCGGKQIMKIDPYREYVALPLSKSGLQTKTWLKWMSSDL